MTRNVIQWLVSVLSVLFLLPTCSTAQQGYNIQLRVNGISNQNVILGYHSNKQMFVKDTVKLNDEGIGVFSGTAALPGGIYLFYLPNGNFFDFLIDKEQHFSIKADTADFYKTLEITGASEPKVFHQLQLFMEEKGIIANTLREQLQKHENDPAKVELLQKQLELLNEEVKHYWKEIERLHQGSFIATFVKALQEVPLPEFVVPPGTRDPDSLLHFKRAWYMKDHFFDNIDLTDARLIRTPFFHHKLERYFTQILIPIPDTVINQSIRLIERARPSNDMFRYLVQFIFNHVNSSQIMGMDAAMVAIADKYYLSGDAPWASEEFITNLRKRVEEIRPTLIGKIGQDLKMEGLHGEFFRLHEVNAAVTVLVFYEPECGHCKKEIPLLYKNVFEPYRAKGVQFFAVYNLNDRQKWEAFVNENGLFGWINVYDPFHQTRFRDFYDVRTTPMIYVLDRNKRIIAKRIDSEQLPSFLDRVLKQGLN